MESLLLSFFLPALAGQPCDLDQALEALSHRGRAYVKRMRRTKPRKLPTDRSVEDFPPEVRAALQEIMNLLHERVRVAQLLDHLVDLVGDQPKPVHMRRALAKYERQSGFKRARVVPGFSNGGDVDDEFRNFYDFLSKGALARDQGFDPGSAHGVEGHRVQWFIINREYELNPSRFGGYTPAELYTWLAHPQGRAIGIWNLIFDWDPDALAATAPESLRASPYGDLWE